MTGACRGRAKDASRDAEAEAEVAEDAEVVDCGKLARNGGILAPGIIDLGVFAVDRRACRAGGVTRVGLMPDQSPVLDDPGIVRRAALMGKPRRGWPAGAARG